VVTRVESQKPKFDYVLWFLIIVLIAGGVSGHYYFADQSWGIRFLGWLIVGAAALGLAYKTKAGRIAWQYGQESLQEVRKVYWPTRQETVQTTLAVLAMVVVMGILLWTADFFLLRAVAWLTGHWSM